MELLGAAGWQLGNVDATVIAQQPRLAPHIDAMVLNLSRAMGVPRDKISVKATTEEKLGFTGKGEGIAAHAVCLIEPLAQP
ncbi:2-C-methyl-D-erythritol 2,4-cyclodiphosphate synthase [bioreactor metagenome]|uniref:2-C-methyl-D-erythritol 2,4-cyclodiphosphate synthase n=1 Tax=bioreactor metagenome TaxID=1076179 RepID=A0A644XZQ9_9ZZZZ